MSGVRGYSDAAGRTGFDDDIARGGERLQRYRIRAGVDHATAQIKRVGSQHDVAGRLHDTVVEREITSARG